MFRNATEAILDLLISHKHSTQPAELLLACEMEVKAWSYKQVSLAAGLPFLMRSSEPNDRSSTTRCLTRHLNACEAIFARCFVRPTPTEIGRPSSARTRRRIALAISAGGPKRWGAITGRSRCSAIARFIASKSARLPTLIELSVMPRPVSKRGSSLAPDDDRLAPTRLTCPPTAKAFSDIAMVPGPPISTIQSTPRPSVSSRTFASQSGVSV